MAKPIKCNEDRNRNVEEIVEIIWKKYLGWSSDAERQNFILQGGSSFSAVQFAEEIESALHLNFPLLIDVILHETFQDVVGYIKVCCSNRHLQGQGHDVKIKGTTQSNESISRLNLTEHVNSIKRGFHQTQQNIIEKSKSTVESSAIFTASEKQTKSEDEEVNLTGDRSVLKESESPYFMSIQRGSKYLSHSNSISHAERKCMDKLNKTFKSGQLLLKEKWQFDMGKCVDASPLIAVGKK